MLSDLYSIMSGSSPGLKASSVSSVTGYDRSLSPTTFFSFRGVSPSPSMIVLALHLSLLGQDLNKGVFQPFYG